MKQILVMMAVVVLVGCGKSDEEKYAESLDTRTKTFEAEIEALSKADPKGTTAPTIQPKEMAKSPEPPETKSNKLVADPNIEKAIRETLFKPKGKLTEADLENVTKLWFDSILNPITDAGLKEVAKLQNLTILDLNSSKVTDTGLKEVAKLQKLEELLLESSKITDVGLKEVAKLQTLEHLNVSGTYITDAGLKELSKLQKLQGLEVAANEITDAGLKELSKLQKLTMLWLPYTQITDAGLKELSKLQKLEELLVHDTQITDAGVAELKKALPNCRITGP